MLSPHPSIGEAPKAYATARSAAAQAAHTPAKSTMASACGKSILIGEHAVVYGAEAIALPVMSMRMQVRVKETSERSTNSKDKAVVEMRLSNRPVSDLILSVAHQALELLDIKQRNLVIDGDSSLWVGAGLGSSASLCVGLLRCFSAHWGIDLSPNDLALLANKLEACFHGKPSGLDVSVVALEQLISFRKGTHPEPLLLDEKHRHFHFAILDSRVRSSTKAMVERAAPYFAGMQGSRRTQNFDTLTKATKLALKSADFEALADCMNTSAGWLSEAGVVSSVNREIQSLALREGALAAKITGAGGGGAVLALLDPNAPTDLQIARLTNLLGHDRVLPLHI